MIVCCSVCAKEGKPSVLGEKEPYTDIAISHGLCRVHFRQMREEVNTYLYKVLRKEKNE